MYLTSKLRLCDYVLIAHKVIKCSMLGCVCGNGNGYADALKKKEEKNYNDFMNWYCKFKTNFSDTSKNVNAVNIVLYSLLSMLTTCFDNQWKIAGLIKEDTWG